MTTAICQHCGRAFPARRSTARYCTPAHRLAAHRGLPVGCPPEPRGAVQDAIVSVSGRSDTPKPDYPSPESRETLKASISRGSKPLPRGIVHDAVYPNMYRVVLPDGSLSDMVNLTRARDAAAALAGRRERRRAA